MNIAILSTTYFPKSNGASIRTDGIARGLYCYGNHIGIIVPGAFYSEEQLPHCKIYRIPIRSSRLASFLERFTKRHFVREHAFRRYVFAILAKEKIDLIHTRQTFDLFILGKEIKQKFGIPWVAEAHKLLSVTDYENKKIPRLFFNYLRKKEINLLNASDLVVTMTESGKKTLEGQGVKKPIIPISNATNITIRKNKDKSFQFEKKYSYLLYAGSIRDVEAVDELIYCFQQVHHQLPLTRLLIIGNGETKKLKILASDLGISDVIYFLDEIPYESMGYYYSHATLFVHYRPQLTYHQNIIGLKFYDAIRCGLPLVVSNVGELGIFVKQRHIGLTFSAGNRRACCDAIIRLLMEKKLYLRTKSNLKKLRNYFTWKRVCKPLHSMYRALVSAHQ